MPTHRFQPYRPLLLSAFVLSTCVWPSLARADCFDDAGAYQHVNPLVLRAIAWLESHNRPDATHLNQNGSVDYGVMQINSIHLRELNRYDISRATLMRPCENVYIAAWHLRRMMDKYGNTWAAVGAYHSQTPAERDSYARHIQRIIAGWHRLPAPADTSTRATQAVQAAQARETQASR